MNWITAVHTQTICIHYVYIDIFSTIIIDLNVKGFVFVAAKQNLVEEYRAISRNAGAPFATKCQKIYDS